MAAPSGPTPSNNWNVSELGLTGTTKGDPLGTGMHLVVSSTQPASAAAEAGFLPHDEILKLEGTPIDHFNILKEELARFGPGSKLKVKILRPGAKPQELTLWLMLPNKEGSAREIPTYHSTWGTNGNVWKGTPEEDATKANLGSIRSAVSIHYGKNEGEYPKRIHDDSFIGSTDRHYMRELPPEHITGSNRVQYVKRLQEGDGQGGWMYAPASGEVWANVRGKDSKGSPFTSY